MMVRWIPAVLVALAMSALPGEARAADDEVRIRLAPSAWDWLELSYECTNLFSVDLRQALESGLPTRLTIQIEVWQDRSSLWDRSVDRLDFGFTILYDMLEASYEVFQEDGDYVMGSKDLADVEEVVGQEENLELVSLEDLDDDATYFVMMEVSLEPLSVREVEDIERWIKGSISKERGGRGFSGISGHLFGVLKNQVGLGERKGSARSESFRPSSLRSESSAHFPDR
jgi:hypothetical protein